MLRRTCFIFVLILIMFCVPYNANADVRAAIKIAGDENYPPYEYVDKNGVYKGFNVDIMRAIAKDLEMDIEIIPMTWENALKSLENNKVHMIQGMTKSSNREEKFAFTKPLLLNSQAIFVKSDTNNIHELMNLSGLKVGIQSGDVIEEYIERIPEIDIVMYSNQENAIKALLSGEVNAFVGNKLTGLYIIQNLKQFNKIKTVGEDLYVTEYCAATLKGNEELLILFNEGLDNIKANGVYDQIYNKWFGQTISDYKAVWRRVLLISGVVFVLVAVVIGVISYWNRSLKKIVGIKTRELEIANNELNTQKEKLQKSNRLKGKILQTIQDGIIALKIDGEIIGANQAAKELLKIENEEGRTIEELKLNNGFIDEGYQHALQGNIWRKSVEWEMDTNQTLNIEINGYPIKSPNCEVEGVIIVLHDYTERNLLNEAMEYDKLKTEFFANISHEFRTPISVIHAASQLLKLHGKGDRIDDLKGAIDKSVYTIRQNINRLTRLIDNIIDVTKADTGFIQLQLGNYNIVSIIEEVTMSVVDLIENKGMEIEFDTDVEEKVIACDAAKIERIILNLLSNSVKFSNEGGKIVVKIEDGEDFITISVKDTGIGIPKEKLEVIFERFRQVDKSISRSHEGSGIGLSLVKSLVELHGGIIKVESVLGAGSEFIIQLPTKINPGEKKCYTNEYYNTEKTEIEFSDIYL